MDSFSLGSPSLSSDVDLTVEGCFAGSSGCIDCSSLRPGSSMAPLGCSSLVDGVVVASISKACDWLDFSNCFNDAIWFGGEVVYLILESQDILL